MLLAALAAAVYHSFVVSQFVPIRIGVVDLEQTASRRIVTITLPDLSGLRGHTVVLGFQLRNGGSDPKRIGLLRDGLQGNRVVLPPNRTIRWDVVLSPELAEVLGAQAGDAPRTLDLTGNADAWAVMGLEIRNYHLRWGDRVTAVVLPASADRIGAGTGSLPVAIALGVLALVSVVLPKSPGRSARLIGNGLALTAFLVCLTCLILPRVSPYKVLLSLPAFWLVAAGLFARGLLGLSYAPHALVVTIRSIVPRVARGWKRHEVTFERGAALLGTRRDRHRSADLRGRVEQSRVLPGQEHATGNHRRGSVCHLSRSSSGAARDRAGDSSDQPEHRHDVSRHRRGAPVGCSRDAVVAAGRSPHVPLGRRGQPRSSEPPWRSPTVESQPLGNF